MNKIDYIHKIINGSSKPKPKPKINMITKGLLRKQVIILISNDNKTKFMETFSAHITNINRVLKNIKSEVIVDFVYIDQTGIVIVTNKVTSSLNLQTIKKYVKNTNFIDSDNINTPYLPQSKLYLKIIGIPYFLKNTNSPILAYVIETIMKENHILNNITVALRF